MYNALLRSTSSGGGGAGRYPSERYDANDAVGMFIVFIFSGYIELVVILVFAMGRDEILELVGGGLVGGRLGRGVREVTEVFDAEEGKVAVL